MNTHPQLQKPILQNTLHLRSASGTHPPPRKSHSSPFTPVPVFPTFLEYLHPPQGNNLPLTTLQQRLSQTRSLHGAARAAEGPLSAPPHPRSLPSGKREAGAARWPIQRRCRGSRPIPFGRASPRLYKAPPGSLRGVGAGSGEGGPGAGEGASLGRV